MQNAVVVEQKLLDEEFQQKQEETEKQWFIEKERYEERLVELNESMQEAEERAKHLIEQLQKPVKDREQKVAFVNNLHLPIQQRDSLLLLGPKGMGKSTFLWLLNKGEMPKRTLRDGTAEIIQLPGYVDSIGLRAWTAEEIIKLLVLMIYEGIPKDLVVFSNERIDLPVTTLGLLGISRPMIVVMSSDFWKSYQPKPGTEPQIHLVPNQDGVRLVHPEAELANVYNFPVYDEIRQFELGTPITHHDDIDALVKKREHDGVQPFSAFKERLGNEFAAGTVNDPNTEALFRFIYIFENKYRKNKLQFMNQATLQDFGNNFGSVVSYWLVYIGNPSMDVIRDMMVYLSSLFGMRQHEPASADMDAVIRAQEEDRQRREEQYKTERQAEKIRFLQVVRNMQDKAAAEREHLQREFQRHQEMKDTERAADARRKEDEYRKQRDRDHALFEQRLAEMRDTTAVERQKLEEDFRQEQQKLLEEIRQLTEQREQEREAERERKKKELEQQLEAMQNAVVVEQKLLDEEFQQKQEETEKQWFIEKERYEERLVELNESMQEAEERAKHLIEQLQKPVKDREQKVAFVNNLHLPIQQRDSLLLLGPKGMGKSTFLWLLNKGEMPKRTLRDGTAEIIQLPGYVDSIGLRAWTAEEIIKLLVLMIYEGIPKDLVVFSNERIDLPVTTLGLLGISRPMIVVMSSDFWKSYQPKPGTEPQIHLVPNQDGVRLVHPEAELANVYNFPVYDEIRQFELGTPITHHDDIDALVKKREHDGVQPFSAFKERLGNEFAAGTVNDPNTEALFRFIYIFENKYRKNKLQFMNQATLQDFV
ncbi:uncharacterized protein LOC129588752 [Paramacrobiotus metropolitanus]|uniref:uncharacterized protein LOC129588752 n=1 Tax=Paramacrobiotus metropolitanus TaxID=2943436 RepID=UPI0024460864|nr:uncharacterized protein LOC129588752 [Paramacrobiotus metropolitanus]